MPQTLERVAGGSHVAEIQAAYELNQRDLFSFALSLTRDPVAAEDIVQEAFLRLIDQAARVSVPDVPRAWLFTVCTNLVRSRARRGRVVNRFRHLLGRESGIESADSPVLRRETRDRVARALAELPSDQRAVFLLAAEGLNGPEIAAAIGRSHGATRQLLYRARTSLRERVGSELM
jgi:RNA polymerase sigma-70 factor (ECF subfamily)